MVGIEADAGALLSSSVDEKVPLSAATVTLKELLEKSESGADRKRKFSDLEEDGMMDMSAPILPLDELVETDMGGVLRKQKTLSGDAGSTENEPANGTDAIANGTDVTVNGATCTTATIPSEEETKSFKGELGPYTSSLEYLDDAFQVLALMLRIAKARHKEDMKEAFNDERPWYDVYRSTKVSYGLLGLNWPSKFSSLTALLLSNVFCGSAVSDFKHPRITSKAEVCAKSASRKDETHGREAEGWLSPTTSTGGKILSNYSSR